MCSVSGCITQDLASSWEIANKRDYRASDQTPLRVRERPVEEDSRVPKYLEIVHKGFEKFINLMGRRG